MELREEEDFIKETVVNRVDLLSKLEQSLKQSVGSTGSAAGRNTLVGSVRSIGSLAGKSIGSNVDHNETILGIKNEEKRETKTNMEPANVKKERSVPKLSKAPSEFQPLVTTNPIQQSLAELRKGIFAANVKKNQNRTTNILADLGQEAISRQNSGRVSTDLTQFENLDNQRNSGLDQIYVNGSIPDLLDISLNLDQDESMVLDTPKQQAQYRSPTTKILNTTPKQTIDIPKMQPLNDTPKQKQFAAQVSKSTPLKNEILPKSEVQTAFKKPHTEALDAVFKSPFKSPQNIYKGQAKSFLPQNQPAQEPESDKPLYSFLQGVVKKPVVKPKIEVKSLQLAQAAAKRERLEKERKQKLKEEREQRTKKMLEDRKLMEKTGNDVSKKQEPKTIGEVKKHDLKPDLSKKPEPLGLKRPAEYQGGQIKKTMKLQSPTKMIKKIVPYLNLESPSYHHDFCKCTQQNYCNQEPNFGRKQAPANTN